MWFIKLSRPASEDGCRISWRRGEVRQTLAGGGVEGARLTGGDTGTQKGGNWRFVSFPAPSKECFDSAAQTSVKESPVSACDQPPHSKITNFRC